jgi:hypothetical protein
MAAMTTVYQTTWMRIQFSTGPRMQPIPIPTRMRLLERRLKGIISAGTQLHGKVTHKRPVDPRLVVHDYRRHVSAALDALAEVV